MDFAQLDLKTASERGSWLHLHHDGKPLFLDSEEEEPKQPCRVKVRGIGSSAVVDAFRRVERSQMLRDQKLARTKDAEVEALLAQFQSEVEEGLRDLITSAVCEWENIQWDGQALALSPENVLKICGPGTLFFDQVQKTLKDKRRLFTKPDTA